MAKKTKHWRAIRQQRRREKLRRRNNKLHRKVETFPFELFSEEESADNNSLIKFGNSVGIRERTTKKVVVTPQGRE